MSERDVSSQADPWSRVTTEVINRAYFLKDWKKRIRSCQPRASRLRDWGPSWDTDPGRGVLSLATIQSVWHPSAPSPLPRALSKWWKPQPEPALPLSSFPGPLSLHLPSDPRQKARSLPVIPPEMMSLDLPRLKPHPLCCQLQAAPDFDRLEEKAQQITPRVIKQLPREL